MLCLLGWLVGPDDSSSCSGIPACIWSVRGGVPDQCGLQRLLCLYLQGRGQGPQIPHPPRLPALWDAEDQPECCGGLHESESILLHCEGEQVSWGSGGDEGGGGGGGRKGEEEEEEEEEENEQWRIRRKKKTGEKEEEEE